MKHTLRKYLSSRGSALFMVVSTMAALIVLVTAMYLSVLSSRSVQLTVFNQEQAYVSSTAITDIIQSYLTGKDSTKLRDALTADTFVAGSKLSTKGNGFAAFTGLDADDEETIFGAYDVTITRLNDEGTSYVYDIAVTVSNNGTLETTHSLMVVPHNPSEIGDMNETFAATGYIPNDVWIDSGTYNGALYFDAEYVRLGDLVGSGGGLSVECEMRCAGSLVCDMATSSPVQLAEPGTWVVGNNLYLESQPNVYDIGGMTKADGTVVPGKIYVGGDLVIKDGTFYKFGASASEPTDIYVVGDAYICNVNELYGNLYVGGNLYLVGDGGICPTAGNLSGNIYLVDNDPEDAETYGNVFIDDGTATYYDQNSGYSTSDREIMKVNGKDYGGYHHTYDASGKMISMYDASGNKVNIFTAGATFDRRGNLLTAALNADGSTGYGNIPGTCTDDVKDFIASCGTWDKQDAIDYLNAALMQTPFYVWTPDTDDAMANPIDIHFNLNNGVATNYVYKIDQDCTINEITAENTGSYQPTILFDTGDAGDQLVVRLGGNNFDDDNNGTDDYFSWMPEGGGNYAVNVITIGEGNLIIDIPAGTKYQAYFMDFVGHIAWFEHLGGTHGVDDNGCEYFDRSTLDFCTDAGDIASYILPHIHLSTGCTDGCATNLQSKTDDDGSVYYTCANHGGEYDQDEYDAIVASGQCPCNNRLEYKKTGFPTSSYGGKSQKANVNIYLVSSDESATIHFSGNGVMNNIYFGFVYAPYMTYMDKGDGGGLKNVGGLIVSDYIMRGAYSYVQCYPDIPLKEIIGDDHKGDGSTSNKPWRVYGV